MTEPQDQRAHVFTAEGTTYEISPAQFLGIATGALGVRSLVEQLSLPSVAAAQRLVAMVRARDTTFRMTNVHDFAFRIGTALGMQGPYFVPECSKQDPQTWTCTIDGAPFTIGAAQYRAIMTGKVSAASLAAELLLPGPATAVKIIDMLRRHHITGPVRAAAYEMEFARVTRANNLRLAQAGQRAAEG